MSVGQCGPDHNVIRNFLEENFNCKVTRIDSTEEAVERLQAENFDLVLVNRKLDIDYSDGKILIKKISGHERLKSIPVMLISNDSTYQEDAIRSGAVAGFGKLEYGKSETKLKLARFLDLRKEKQMA